MNGESNKKKIGIVTIFNVLNYGAVLQGLALYKTIENMGHDVRMINYVPKQLKNRTIQPIYNRDISLYSNIKNFIKRIVLGIGRGKAKSFQQFVRNNEKIGIYIPVVNNHKRSLK